VAYALLFEDNVRRWIRDSSGLSREGRVRLFLNIDQALRDRADLFRGDPQRRPNPELPLLTLDIVLQDPPGSQQFRVFHLVVNDRAAAMGILHIVYIDAD